MSENRTENKGTNATHMKLPNNIRQMGTPGEKQKVYIEDYVYTYLHSYLHEKQKEEPIKAAVLLGEYHKKEGVTYAFFKGAIGCEFAQVQEELTKEMKLTIRNYFPGWDVLGWYVSSQGVDAHVQSEVKHRYAASREHENRRPQYLIYEDALERDVQVFTWEQNALHYLNGFYIYYERNPRMQEFMIMEKGGQSQENVSVSYAKRGAVACEENRTATHKENRTATYKENVSQCFGEMKEILETDIEDSLNKDRGVDEKRTASYKTRQEKKRMAQGKTKRPQRMIYAACAAVLVVLVAMGVTQIGNYQNLKQLQEAISTKVIPAWGNQFKDAPQDKDELQEEDVLQNGDNRQGEGSSLTVDVLEDGRDAVDSENAEILEENDELLDIPTGNANDILQETQPQGDESLEQGAASLPEATTEYVVQKGDSLYSISRAFYENEEMVDAICERNGITNVHLIFEGQTLKLP